MSQSCRILIVEDDSALRLALIETLSLNGFDIVAEDCAESALAQLEKTSFDMILSDVQMPGLQGNEFLVICRQRWPEIPVVLMTAYAEVDQAVAAIRRGAADYICKPFQAEVLLEIISRIAQQPTSCGEPLFKDESTQRLAELARRVASTDASVVISGESGVGKEVFARYVHDNSTRRNQSFIAINCAAIPEQMLESILFGFEKGAFTGAYTARAGKFEQANGGTLLLDEISEMDLALQAKILRVLQEREVERLGGKQTIELDVRIIATTNRDLAAHVEEGHFREDLYYRLNVFPLQIPPLRERRDDILPLCHRFIREGAPGEGIVIDSFAEQMLQSYNWPGNVRELHNVIQRALILKSGHTVDQSAILFEQRCTDDPLSIRNSNPVEENPQLADDLRSREMELIIQTLNDENGSRKDAARRLGISPRTLRYKLARFREQGVSIPDLASTGTA